MNKILRLFLEKNIIHLQLIVDDIKKIKDTDEIYFEYIKEYNIFNDNDTVPLSFKKYILTLLYMMPAETAGVYGKGLIEELHGFIKHTDKYKYDVEFIYEDIEYKINQILELIDKKENYKNTKKDLEYFLKNIKGQKRVFNI